MSPDFLYAGTSSTPCERTGCVSSARAATHLVPTQATDDPAAIGPADVALFCVKLWDVESAGERIRPLIRT